MCRHADATVLARGQRVYSVHYSVLAERRGPPEPELVVPSVTPVDVRTVALGLGANTGRPVDTLVDAVLSLAEALDDVQVGGLYRSRPLSPHPQPDFFNTAVVARAAASPDELLALCKALEWAFGRRRGLRWGPRILDLDLLLVGDLERDEPHLVLPHPRLRQRLFAVAPLADVAPDWEVPPDGRSVSDLKRDLGAQAVTALPWPARARRPPFVGNIRRNREPSP